MKDELEDLQIDRGVKTQLLQAKDKEIAKMKDQIEDARKKSGLLACVVVSAVVALVVALVYQHLATKDADNVFEVKGFGVEGRYKQIMKGLNGVYTHKPGDEWNGKPVFEKFGGGMFMYFKTNLRWAIASDRSHFPESMALAVSATIWNASPHTVDGWKVPDDDGQWILAPSVELRTLSAHEYGEAFARMAAMSFEIKGFGVEGAHKSKGLNGVYRHKPGDEWNGKPVFEKVGGGMFMYYATTSFWTITNDRSEFPESVGLALSATIGDASPHTVDGWKVFDDDGQWVLAPSVELRTLSAHEYGEAIARMAAMSFEIKGFGVERKGRYTHTILKYLDGVYTHKSGDEWNGKPVYEKVGGGKFMYYTTASLWSITSIRAFFRQNQGWAISATIGDASPHMVDGWKVKDVDGLWILASSAKLHTKYE